jgi:hypothetical protein
MEKSLEGVDAMVLNSYFPEKLWYVLTQYHVHVQTIMGMHHTYMA